VEMGECELGISGLGQGPVACSCGHGSESSASIIRRNIIMSG
jgi:hypothetical protein